MNEGRIHQDLILLAEDNPVDVMLIQRSLVEHAVEHTMLTMEDGQQAIEYIDRIEADETEAVPDLLLLDLNLPSCDGREILARVRRSVRSYSTPVVIVTSSNSDEDREMARRLRATDYFLKVPDLDGYMKLGGIVKQILSSRSSLGASM
jgi:CheY-like chemotaxis protein